MTREEKTQLLEGTVIKWSALGELIDTLRRELKEEDTPKVSSEAMSLIVDSVLATSIADLIPKEIEVIAEPIEDAPFADKEIPM